jgi:Raf kinase inhibitor-like YbhB/YbcL family protein
MADDSLIVSSSTFSEGETIPLTAAFAAVGGENRSPALSWTDGPEGTAAYAVSCYDPDAPTTVGFTHWLVFNLSPTVTGLEEGAGSAPAPGGGVSGFTDWGESSYGGMAPPAEDDPHRYQFTVYALDTDQLPLDATTTYAKFRFLIRGHVLASGSLTGRFGLTS